MNAVSALMMMETVRTEEVTNDHHVYLTNDKKKCLNWVAREDLSM